MKKLIAIVAIVFFAGAFLTSCKSQQKCPAYSKNTSSKVLSRA
jgi:hypothetical protein